MFRERNKDKTEQHKRGLASGWLAGFHIIIIIWCYLSGWFTVSRLRYALWTVIKHISMLLYPYHQFMMLLYPFHTCFTNCFGQGVVWFNLKNESEFLSWWVSIRKMTTDLPDGQGNRWNWMIEYSQLQVDKHLFFQPSRAFVPDHHIYGLQFDAFQSIDDTKTQLYRLHQCCPFLFIYSRRSYQFN